MAKPRLAILTLEQPWWPAGDDPNQTSVLPFLRGLAQFRPDLKLLQASFVDRTSFEASLDNLLTLPAERRIIYVASHGTNGHLGGMRRDTAFGNLWRRATEQNIEGIVFGACSFGSNADWMKEFTQGSSLRWMFAYSAEIDWLSSNLIDIAVLEAMADIGPRKVKSAAAIVKAAASALSLFNPERLLDTENSITIKKSVVLVAQQAGKGHHARDLSEELRAAAWPAAARDQK